MSFEVENLRIGERRSHFRQGQCGGQRRIGKRAHLSLYTPPQTGLQIQPSRRESLRTVILWVAKRIVWPENEFDQNEGQLKTYSSSTWKIMNKIRTTTDFDIVTMYSRR